MSSALRYFCAIDLGSSNGRVVLGIYNPDCSTLAMHEAYRFNHKPVEQNNKLFWDWERISRGVIDGLLQAASMVRPGRIESISCDSWGQDFGMLDADGNLLQNPYTYRNSFYTEKSPEISRFYNKPYPAPGAISTLNQLAIIRRMEPELLEQCSNILHMAELIHHLIGSTLNADPTLNGIARLVNYANLEYDWDLIGKLELPCRIFPEQHKGVIGSVTHPELLNDFAGTRIISGSGHDTAGAIFGAQLQKNEFFVSLGSYLMCAVAVDRLPGSLPEGYSVIPTVDGKYAVSVGGNGMYIQQKTIEAWQQSGLSVDCAELDKKMMSAENYGTFNVNDPIFKDSSGSMPCQISHLLNGCCAPDDTAGIWRSIYCSMSDELDRCFTSLKQIAETGPDQAVLVSGGVKNQLLTDEFCRRNHLSRRAAAIESSAAGNLMNQLQYHSIDISKLTIEEN